MRSNCDLHYIDSQQTNFEGASDETPILLYMSPIISSSRFFQLLSQNITKLNQQIRQIKVDLRGTGCSQEVSKIDSISDFAEDIKYFVKSKLKLSDDEAYRRLILVGYYVGGPIALYLAAKWPKIFRRLILINSNSLTGYHSYKIDQFGQTTTVQCQTRDEVIKNSNLNYLQSFIENGDAQGIKNHLKSLSQKPYRISESEYDDLSKEALLQTNLQDCIWAIHNFDLLSEMPQKVQEIVGPVLIVHGCQDIYVSTQKTEKMVKDIGPEKCKVILKEDSGPLIVLEDPEYLADQIIQFIKQDK